MCSSCHIEANTLGNFHGCIQLDSSFNFKMKEMDLFKMRHFSGMYCVNEKRRISKGKESTARFVDIPQGYSSCISSSSLYLYQFGPKDEIAVYSIFTHYTFLLTRYEEASNGDCPRKASQMRSFHCSSLTFRAAESRVVKQRTHSFYGRL